MKLLFAGLLVLAFLFGFVAPIPSSVSAAQEVATEIEVIGDLEMPIALANQVLEFSGMLGMGIPGFGLAALLISLLMTAMKAGKNSSLFQKIPKNYRSFTPLVLGGILGGVESAARGAPWIAGVVNGMVAGGGQQVAYQQLKGTGLGNVLEAFTSIIPRPYKQ